MHDPTSQKRRVADGERSGERTGDYREAKPEWDRLLRPRECAPPGKRADDAGDHDHDRGDSRGFVVCVDGARRDVPWIGEGVVGLTA
ncbi:MAG: hypothetical protein NVS4B3_29010 [Gemmatimonadaceae bacterium]